MTAKASRAGAGSRRHSTDDALGLRCGGDKLVSLREGVLERLGGPSVGNLGKPGGDRLGRALALIEVDAGRLADMRDREDAGARAENDARGRILAHKKQHARRHAFRRHKLRCDRRQQAFRHACARRRRQDVDADIVLRALEVQDVHEPDHARLRGAVVRLPEIAVDAGRRRREHDTPIVAFPHARPDRLRAVGRADQVYADDELEIRHLHLGEGLVAQHASVVDENVDVAPQPFGACNHLGDLIKIGDVRIVRDRCSAGRSNLFHNPHGIVEASVLTEIIDDNVRSARRKSQSMRTSETGARAGDDGHSAFKADCHKISPCRRLTLPGASSGTD